MIVTVRCYIGYAERVAYGNAEFAGVDNAGVVKSALHRVRVSKKLRQLIFCYVCQI